MHKATGGRHASQGEDSVALTSADAAGSMLGRLNQSRPNASIAKTLLAPLREGKAVVLRVTDPRLPKRKRIVEPLLFLTPLGVYGGLSPRLMIALQTYGCEVCDTREPVLPVMLYRMGLSAKLSGVLASELNQVFTKESHHGSTRT